MKMKPLMIALALTMTASASAYAAGEGVSKAPFDSQETVVGKPVPGSPGMKAQSSSKDGAMMKNDQAHATTKGTGAFDSQETVVGKPVPGSPEAKKDQKRSHNASKSRSRMQDADKPAFDSQENVVGKPVPGAPGTMGHPARP